MARGGVAGIGLFFVALGKWDHYMEKKKSLPHAVYKGRLQTK